MPIASMAGPGLAAFLVWYSSLPSWYGWSGGVEVFDGSNPFAVSVYETAFMDDEVRVWLIEPFESRQDETDSRPVSETGRTSFEGCTPGSIFS
jgi:hypothetical protein